MLRTVGAVLQHDERGRSRHGEKATVGEQRLVMRAGDDKQVIEPGEETVLHQSGEKKPERVLPAQLR